MFDAYLKSSLNYPTKGGIVTISSSNQQDLETAMEEIKRLSLVEKVELVGRRIKVLPKQLEFSSHVLEQLFQTLGHPEKRDSRPKLLLTFPLPLPFQPFSGAYLRALFTASFIAKCRRRNGWDVEFQSLVYPVCEYTGYLLLVVEKGGFDLDCNENILELGISVQKAIMSQEFSAESAREAMISLVNSTNSKYVIIWNSIYRCWKSHCQKIFDNFGLHLTITDNPIPVSSNTITTQFQWISQAVITKGHDKYVWLSEHTLAHIYQDLKNTGSMKDLDIEILTVNICGGLNCPELSKCFDEATGFVAAESKADLQVEGEQEKVHMLAVAFFVIQLLSVRLSSKLEYSGCKLNNENGTAGIYIEYSYARICGIERFIKSELEWSPELDQVPNLDCISMSPSMFGFIETMSRYPAILAKSTSQPCVLVAYITLLAKLVSSQYYHLRIKGEPIHVQKARWAILYCAKKIFEDSFHILSIPLIRDI
jgi:uncharacterized protein YlbG (UPF0298 family)